MISIWNHTINPKSGYPVDNNLISVTIVASTCTDADGFATAVMALGLNDGLDLINNNDQIEGLIIKKEAGEYIINKSKGFEKFLIN